MRDLVRDSTLGHILHAISGGKILGWEEDHDHNALSRFVSTGDNARSMDTIELVTSRTSESRHSNEKPSESDVDLGNSNRKSSESEVDLGNSDRKSSERDPDPGTSNKKSSESEAEKGKDYELIDWLPDDPANPRNWSMGKKFFVTFEICFLTTSVYIGSAIYTAGLGGVIEQFHVSETVALLGLTLFVGGYALGPMVWAPMSEIPFFGRTTIYILTLVVFVFFQFGVIYAKNIGMLLAFRFLTGLFGSPVLATGGATIADVYAPRKQVYAMAIWGVAAVCGPALGPLVGGFAAESEGWKWTIWELLWLSGFCLCFLIVFLPETSAANILFRRAVRLRKQTGNDKLKTKDELDAENFPPREVVMMILVRPFTLTFTEPILFALNMYIALIYALLYLWFESFPIVFIEIYHFSLGTEGLAFLGLLIGAFIVIPPFFYWAYKYLEPKFNENGELRPEERLVPAMIGAFFIPICLFWFGWSSRPSVHWIMPIIGSAFFPIGAFGLFMAVLSYLGDAYPAYVASVYAGNDLFRSGFAAAFPLFANAMYKKLGVDWASSMLGFISIAFIPIPFVLYRYGEQLRKRSKMARHDI